MGLAGTHAGEAPKWGRRMKVRMVLACMDEEREYKSGDEVDLPDVKAERFVKAGLAEKYDAPATPRAAPVIEAAAVAPAAETATLPPGKKKPA